MLNEDRAKDIVQRYGILKSDRTPWVELFEDIRTYIYSTTASFTNDGRAQVYERNRKIFDPTAQIAHSKLVGAIMSGMTNSAIKWFNLAVADQKIMQVATVKDHLENATNEILAIFSNTKSNFYSAIHEAYFEVTGLGTCAEFKRGKGRKAHYETVPLADYFFEENDYGEVDCVYRPIDMTPKQILDQFRDDIKDSNLISVLENESQAGSTIQKRRVIHCVKERYKRDSGKTDKLNKKYESVYVLETENFILAEDGFDDFPYYVARWERIAGREVLGRGIAMKAIPDAKVLNQMVKTNLEAGEAMVRPPLQAPYDAFMRPIDLTSKKVNYYKNVIGMNDPTAKPLITVGNLPIGLEMENQRRTSILQTFLVDLLQNNKVGVQTQLEVSNDEQARMRLMAPQMTRIEVELLSPIVMDLYSDLIADGTLDDVPEELKEHKVMPIYNSPLSRAQKQTQSMNLQRFLNGISQIGQIYPDVFLVPKQYELVEEMAEIEAIPRRMLNSKEEVKVQKEAMDKARQQQQAVDQAKTASEAGLNIANIQSLGSKLNAGV